MGIRLVSAVGGICHIWIDQTQKGGTAGQAFGHDVKETLEVVLWEQLDNNMFVTKMSYDGLNQASFETVSVQQRCNVQCNLISQSVPCIDMK